MKSRLIVGALLVAFTLAAVAPIRSYDSFWHLATGRWIVDQRALPATDPFAVASDRKPWINGEWLFEVVLYGAERLVGLDGLSWLRALLIAAIFTLAYWFARGEADDAVALLLACIAFAGGLATLDVRPSAVAALLALLAVQTACRGSVAGYVILTILWINIHPSALLAPAIAFVMRPWRWQMWGAAAVALLVNPYGWRGIAAPLELMAYVGSGEFVNAEWLPSSPVTFPLLYIAVAVGFLAYGTAEDRRAQLWRMVLFAMFAYLAIRHVRNQGLFFAVYPLLVAPSVRRGRVPARVAYAAAIAAILFVAVTTEHRTGPQPSRFPVETVARVKQSGLRGNVYNPDQFGGYLIWSFYPERRTLTDGRNELHHHYTEEYGKARLDERAWRALLEKYDVQLAVDEYRPPLPVQDYRTKEVRQMPASLAYWPRRDWALIAFDESSMAFARRDAFPAEQLEKWEIRGIVPDAPR